MEVTKIDAATFNLTDLERRILTLEFKCLRSKSQSNFRRRNFRSKSKGKADTSNSEIYYYYRKFGTKVMLNVLYLIICPKLWPSLINRKTNFAVDVKVSDTGLANNRLIFIDKSSGLYFLVNRELISLLFQDFAQSCPQPLNFLLLTAL